MEKVKNIEISDAVWNRLIIIIATGVFLGAAMSFATQEIIKQMKKQSEKK